MGNSRNPKKRAIQYPFLIATRIDRDSSNEIGTVALFERQKPATWLRDLVVEALKKYERNPQYLRFKKQLEAREGNGK